MPPRERENILVGSPTPVLIPRVRNTFLTRYNVIAVFSISLGVAKTIWKRKECLLRGTLRSPGEKDNSRSYRARWLGGVSTRNWAIYSRMNDSPRVTSPTRIAPVNLELSVSPNIEHNGGVRIPTIMPRAEGEYICRSTQFQSIMGVHSRNTEIPRQEGGVQGTSEAAMVLSGLPETMSRCKLIQVSHPI